MTSTPFTDQHEFWIPSAADNIPGEKQRMVVDSIFVRKFEIEKNARIAELETMSKPKNTKGIPPDSSLTIRVVVTKGTNAPISKGMEVEYIGTVDLSKLAIDTLGSCIQDAGINKVIQGQQVVNVIPIPQPKPSIKKAKKK